jgi:hypothetical protein
VATENFAWQSKSFKPFAGSRDSFSQGLKRESPMRQMISSNWRGFSFVEKAKSAGGA